MGFIRYFISSEREKEYEILYSAMGNLPSNWHLATLLETSADRKSSTDFLELDRGAADRLKLRRRLISAVFGWSFLIGPMWIMVLHNTLYTGLTITTAFTAVFGLITVFHNQDEKDILASTAAYAAVLVVFVGLNNNV